MEHEIISKEDEMAQTQDKKVKAQSNMEGLESDCIRLSKAREVTPYDRKQIKMLQTEIGQYVK